MLATPRYLSGLQVISDDPGSLRVNIKSRQMSLNQTLTDTVKLGQWDHVSVECIHEYYTVYGNNKQGNSVSREQVQKLTPQFLLYIYWI